MLLQSCNSRALYRLGDAQLSLYDNDDPTSANAKQTLKDAELSYRASIELEGSSSIGGEAPVKITEQRWFKEQEAKKEAEKKTAAAGGTPQKTASSQAGKAASPAGRGGNQAGRGSSTPSEWLKFFITVAFVRLAFPLNLRSCGSHPELPLPHELFMSFPLAN